MAIREVIEGAVRLSELAMDVASVSDPGTTGQRIADLAGKLIPCAAADIVSVTAAGDLRIRASSDPGMSGLTEVAWRQWPHLPVPEGIREQRREYHSGGYARQLLAASRVAGELIFSLQIGHSDHGYLRFLFLDDVARASPIGDLAAAFAAHAAIAIDRAALQGRLDQLQTALETNREISAGVGVLMERHQIDYDTAFTRLKSESQNTNRRLRDVAVDLLGPGQLLAQRSVHGFAHSGV